jgi:hypothetical protein
MEAGLRALAREPAAPDPEIDLALRGELRRVRMMFASRT